MHELYNTFRLKNLNAELEKIPRSDDRYLALLTEEHSIIKEETTLKADLAELEIKEREAFSILSQSLRDSHEKERAQSEKTKYWSLVGSCIGALIGIIGELIYSYHLRVSNNPTFRLRFCNLAWPQ